MTTSARSPRARWTPFVHGAVIAGLLFAAYLFVVIAPAVRSFGFDAFAYWAVNPDDPYGRTVGGLGAFTYTPVAARVFGLAGLLSWPAFLWLWSAILLGTCLWLGGRRFLWVLAFPPVALELYHGNIHLLLAAMTVLGFRYPAVWAFGMLTKATPGVGLVWFLVRREWRPLAIALGVTAVIAAVSVAVDGRLWGEWFAYALSANAGEQVQQAQLTIPLVLRVPIAAAVVAWGAWTDRRWAVPVGVTLAMPVLWPTSFAVLAACLPLSRHAGRPLVRLGRARSAASPAGTTTAADARTRSADA